MNKLNLQYKAREVSRILADAKNRDLTYMEETRIDEIIEEINFDIGQSKNNLSQSKSMKSDPSHWPLNSERRRAVDKIAFMEYLRHGDPGQQLRPLMRLAQQSTTPTDGGYTIPETIAIEIEQAIKHIGGMWEAARHVVTQRGSKMPWPMADDTNNYAVIIAENSDLESGAQAVPFGVSNFESVKYTSKIIKVSSELLQDSDLFLPAFIELLATRIWRGTNIGLSTGSGSDEPNGLTNAAVYGVSTADDAAITFEDLTNLVHSVDNSYRKSWMFHDSVLKYLTTVKSGDNYVFPEIWINQTLLGYPFVINNELPAYTQSNDGKKIAFFGDFSKYIIRTTPLAIRRFPTIFGETDEVGFAAILRCDGDLIDAGTHPVKYLRMATT